MRINFKPGDDLFWPGLAELEGVTDFFGYTLEAQFRKRLDDGTPDATALATAECDWVDTAAGTFTVAVDKLVTAEWPVGIRVLFDVKVIDPSGEVATSETGELTTVARVTQ